MHYKVHVLFLLLLHRQHILLLNYHFLYQQRLVYHLFYGHHKLQVSTFLVSERLNQLHCQLELDILLDNIFYHQIVLLNLLVSLILVQYEFRLFDILQLYLEKFLHEEILSQMHTLVLLLNFYLEDHQHQVLYVVNQQLIFLLLLESLPNDL